MENPKRFFDEHSGSKKVVVEYIDAFYKKNTDLVLASHLLKETQAQQITSEASMSSVTEKYKDKKYDAVKQTLKPLFERKMKSLKRLYSVSRSCTEVHALDCNYFKKSHQPLLDECTKTTIGDYVSNDPKCVWSSDEEIEKLVCSEKNKVRINEAEKKNRSFSSEIDEWMKGIPNFWLTVFKSVGLLAEMVQEHDEPILKHLVDVEVQFSKINPTVFVIKFYFSPNEYFTNPVLTKAYKMTLPWGEIESCPEIYKCKGCSINWKYGKNVTVKVEKLVKEDKRLGICSCLWKTKRIDSFFNYFNPPTEQLDRGSLDVLKKDFEIGQYIRERIVPQAFLYFIGEARDDEDYEYGVGPAPRKAIILRHRNQVQNNLNNC